MATAFFENTVEVTEQEHILGELSKENLQTAKNLFDSKKFVIWHCLWPQNAEEVERETLDVLGTLRTESNFIYVQSRSLLPREIVCNKFVTAFLFSQFPTAKLLQIYARHATTTNPISLQSPNAVSPLLVQMIIPHKEHPLSVNINFGGQHIHLKGQGLAFVRSSAADVSIHIETPDYTVVTMDYTLGGETTMKAS